MKSSSLCSSEGKGLLGCIIAIALFGVVLYLAINLGPIYYSNFSFESSVKTTASRAGSHAFSDEMIVKELMGLAKRNQIRIAREDIKIERFAGQLHITVRYSVPVDFVLLERDLDFKIEASSFIGAL